MRKVLFSPTDLLGLPPTLRASQFLRQIVPYGIAATQSYGSGFYLKDVLAPCRGLPGALRTNPCAWTWKPRRTDARMTSSINVLAPGRPQREVALETTALPSGITLQHPQGGKPQ